MKRGLFAALALASMGALAQRYVPTYYLVSEWFDNGNQMCKYDNGTVLNMGRAMCPRVIKG